MITPFGRFGGTQDTRILVDVIVSAFTLSGGPGTGIKYNSAMVYITGNF